MSGQTIIEIPLSAPHLTGRELDFLQSIDPRNLPALAGQFEREIRQLTGAGSVLATQSGTSALELALRTLDIGLGDSVICPTLTFSATANAIYQTKAMPVFVGSESATWGLDPDALETALKSLSKRPKAIVVVDLYGMPARWNELQQVSDYYDVPLVADAAESLGSRLNGSACGRMGLLNVISFNQNKIITAQGGGVLLTDAPSLMAKAQLMANQGRQAQPPYEQFEPGGNYKISPVLAGIGLCQLPMLTERVAQRRAIFSQYYMALHHSPGLCFQPEPVGAFSNRWLTALTIDHKQASVTRDQISNELRKEGIETRPVFPPLHSQRAYRNCPFYGTSLAGELASTGLCLPSGSGLSRQEVERVIDVLKKKLGCH